MFSSTPEKTRNKMKTNFSCYFEALRTKLVKALCPEAELTCLSLISVSGKLVGATNDIRILQPRMSQSLPSSGPQFRVELQKLSQEIEIDDEFRDPSFRVLK